MRVCLLNGVNVVERTRLDNDDVFESIRISHLRNGAPAIATERIRQGHPAVLLGTVRLGCALGDPELVLGNQNVGCVCTATEPSASVTVTNCLYRLDTCLEVHLTSTYVLQRLALVFVPQLTTHASSCCHSVFVS